MFDQKGFAWADFLGPKPSGFHKTLHLSGAEDPFLRPEEERVALSHWERAARSHSQKAARTLALAGRIWSLRGAECTSIRALKTTGNLVLVPSAFACLEA
jgi:hypothetical protein